MTNNRYFIDIMNKKKGSTYSEHSTNMESMTLQGLRGRKKTHRKVKVNHVSYDGTK